MNKIIENEFHTTFALSKTKMFNVSYYTLGSNKNANFTTSCDVFNRPKSDYAQCGQCQEDVLKRFITANTFYKKWNVKHLSILTQEEFQEMTSDLEVLFNKYPHIIEQAEKEPNEIRFNKEKDFSMTVYR